MLQLWRRMRYLLLDRITSLVPGVSATGVKCVSLSDDIFVDHFPGHPVMPGALIIEALAQLAGVLVEATMRKEREGQSGELHALLVMVDRARFRKLVRPGDRLVLEAKALRVKEDGARASVVARLDGDDATTAELGYTFVPVDNAKLIARRHEVLNVWLSGSSESGEIPG